MLASLEDLDAYGLAPRPEVLSEVSDSSCCSVCGAEPLPASASFAETADWFRRHNPPVLALVEAETLAERTDLEARTGVVERDVPVDWRSLRTTHSYDSQLAPGYAVSAISMPAAIAAMDPDQQDFFANAFLAALCGFCTSGPAERENLLLRSYVNQRADGNLEVARRQPSWSEIERIAAIVTDAAPVAVQLA